MKVVIAPDSFKGSLTAKDAAEAMAAAVHQARPDVETQSFPLGDGGDGTVDALVAAVPGSRKVHCRVMGPLGEPVRAYYGLLGQQGHPAVVEMAAASGLTLVPEDKRDPLETTTYGTGELIGYAAGEPGVDRVIVGLGGSATNDGGAGALQALGVCFFDRSGIELPSPIRARDLPRIARADWRRAGALQERLIVTIACDVTNPLCGAMGASYVFGPQKGATPEVARELDDILYGFSPILDRMYQERGGE
ncbi:MAG TPA: glycerate kinase, partial [Capsulimonadaceae bacterium]|nr:glycerate kinase [Capsulimonadaceae bacterium]